MIDPQEELDKANKKAIDALIELVIDGRLDTDV